MVYSMLFDNDVLQKVDGKVVEIYRYNNLDGKFGKKLIFDWYRRGINNLGCQPDESFEPFIYTWIAFNAWSTCVTGEDQDIRQRAILAQDSDLQAKFDIINRFNPNEQSASAYIKKFHTLWPIFSVKSMRKNSVERANDFDSREDQIKHYHLNNISFQPRDAKEWDQKGQEIPIDWPHMLCAVAQVRNNLFHGDKSPASTTDRIIVHAAFHALAGFLQEAELIMLKSG